MKIQRHNDEIEIVGVSDFDLGLTFECGQCFRWDIVDYNRNNAVNCTYIGVAFGHVVKVRRVGKSVFISCSEEEFEGVWHNYFDLDLDYAVIRQQLCIDDFMEQVITYGKGIRLLRQEKWEVLCSFILSQNNNIPRIKSIIDTLCREFGDEIEYEGKTYYTFPSAEKIAALDTERLAPLRCGYRADYIIRSAKAVADGSINLEALTGDTPDIARLALKTLHGVGDKVADCVMLFGLHMLNAFPVDVWMERAVVKHYGTDFDPAVFSPYAGIAQQYIFNYARNIGIK